MDSLDENHCAPSESLDIARIVREIDSTDETRSVGAGIDPGGRPWFLMCADLDGKRVSRCRGDLWKGL